MRDSTSLALAGALVLVCRSARADVIAYDGFAGPAGVLDGQAGGVGWDTGARALGSGGTDGACDGIICACPELPDDGKVVRGHSGPAWTTSSLNTVHNTVLAQGLT